MKRKMVIIGISYILGLFFASFFSLSRLWLLVIAAGCVYLSFLMFYKSEKVLLLSAAAFSAGLLLYMNYSFTVCLPVLQLEGVNTVFTGKVVASQVYDDEFTVYLLDGAFESGPEANILCMGDNFDCAYGDILTVWGTFSPPEGDYLYDSTRYYQGKSVFLQADSDCKYRVTYTEGYELIRSLARYRSQVQQRIYALGGQTGGGIAAAMLFGSRAGLEPSIESGFYQAGLGPMLSVSGFHLVLFTGLCGIIGRKTRLQRMLQFGLTVLLVILFSLVAMWPISVLRAGIMLLLSRSACLFFRKADGLNSLCISVIILTAVQPYLIHDTSFLLSVTGTFGISVFAPYMTEKLRPCHWYGVLGKQLLSGVLVTLCTMPICICCFSGASLLAPVSNVLLAPFCIILMICAIVIFFLGGLPGLPELCGQVIDAVGTFLADILKWTELNLPIAYPLGDEALPEITFTLCAALILAFFALRRRRVLYGLLTLSAAVLFARQIYVQCEFREKLRVAVLGRNAEQVIVISYGGDTHVIDRTGERKNAEHLLKYLTEQGLTRIDTLCIAENVTAMAPVYNEMLHAIDVEQVLTGTGHFLREKDTICLQIPEADEIHRIETEDYTIEISEGTLLLSAFGKTVFADSFEEKPEIDEYDYIIAGCPEQKCQQIWSFEGGEQVLCSGRNLELVLCEEKAIEIRRLE
ncbi:MAG: ComEC/Rec2 family competence protein [Ruminococcus sp.]|nr:ComEC/Rec2 family competence protein [Ruminococcus sp.]